MRCATGWLVDLYGRPGLAGVRADRAQFPLGNWVTRSDGRQRV